jgi:glutaminyl-tRNA synthetase
MGTRQVPFSKVIYIEQEDFREEAPKKYFRMMPGQEVRLRSAYIVKCEGLVKNSEGQIVEVRCTYDPQTRGGSTPDGRKVKGTIHWVSAEQALDAEVRLFDPLFSVPNPGAERDFREDLNPDSLEVLTACKVEPGLADAPIGARFQFERVGYFCVDRDRTPGCLVFNRTVALRDSWAKIEKRQPEE